MCLHISITLCSYMFQSDSPSFTSSFIHNLPKSPIVIHQLIISDYYYFIFNTAEEFQFPHHYGLSAFFFFVMICFTFQYRLLILLRGAFAQNSENKKDESHLCRLVIYWSLSFKIRSIRVIITTKTLMILFSLTSSRIDSIRASQHLVLFLLVYMPKNFSKAVKVKTFP